MSDQQVLSPDLPDQKTITTVQKLLSRTDERGATEHEAAAVQAHVMRILNKYNLSLAEFDQIANPPEEIGTEQLPNEQKSIPIWKNRLLFTLAKAHFCDMYSSTSYRRKCHVIVGKPTNVQAVKIVYSYLVSVVDDAAMAALKEYTGWEHGKTFTNSFRMGMVARISERLKAEMNAIHQENVAEAMAQQEEQFEQEPMAIGPENDSQPLKASHALVVANVYQEAQKEIQEFYKTKGLKLRFGGYSGANGSGAGYKAGKSAGDRVPLHSSSSLNRKNK